MMKTFLLSVILTLIATRPTTAMLDSYGATEDFNTLPTNRLYVQLKGSVYEASKTRVKEVFAAPFEHPMLLAQSTEGFIYRFYAYPDNRIFLFDPLTFERKFLEGTSDFIANNLGLGFTGSSDNKLYYVQSGIYYEFDLENRELNSYAHQLRAFVDGPNSTVNLSGSAINPLNSHLYYSTTHFVPRVGPSTSIHINNANHKLVEEIELPFAIQDFAFDEYGELYGVIDGYLHHVDLNKKLSTRVSSAKIDQMFSVITQPRPYALAPKGIFFGQLKTGEPYHGQIKIRNHESSDFSIKRIYTTSPAISISGIAEPLVLDRGETVYLDYEVVLNQAEDFDHYIVAELQTSTGLVLDSIRLEGAVYEKNALAENTFYGYSAENSRFTAHHLADSSQQDYVFPNLTLDAVAFAPSGRVFAFAKEILYEIDPFHGDADQVARVLNQHGLAGVQAKDFEMVNDSVLYTLHQGSGETLTYFLGAYYLASDSFSIKKRFYAMGSDGHPDAGIPASTIALSRHTNTIYFSGKDSLYRWPLEDTVWRTVGNLALGDAELVDLFTDEKDDLYGIFSEGDKSYLAEVSKYSGETVILAELATTSTGLAKHLPDVMITATDQQPAAAELLIFPNPAAGSFFMKATKPLNSVQLHDPAGRLHPIEAFNRIDDAVYQVRFATNSLTPGIYFLKLHYADRSTDIERIIIR